MENLDNDLDKLQVRVAHTVSKIEYDSDREMVEQMAYRQLVDHLSHFIAREKMEITEYDGRVEFKIELYVAKAQKFWDLINKKAEEISYRWQTLGNLD